MAKQDKIHIDLPVKFFHINIAASRFKSIFCYCVLLTLVPFSSDAQYPGNWYLGKVLNDNNGLPQNSVRSLYFDKQTGFLWMTTEAGLVRYDGTNARVFDLRDLPYLKSIRMFTFFPALNGDILGCNRVGDVFLIKDNYVQDMYGKYAVHVYNLSHENSNVKSIHALNFEKDISDQLFPSDPITNTLWINKDMWLATSGNFISFFRNEKLLRQWPKKKGDFPFMIAKNNSVYILTKNATGYRISLADTTITTVTANDTAINRGKPVLFYDKVNDQPLLLNNSNVYEVNFENSIILARHVATLSNLPSNVTSVILHHDKKTLFIATNSTGLYIYHLSPFVIYRADGDDILNNNGACVLTDSVHIFTSRSVFLDLNTGNSRRFPIPITHTQSLGVDAGGNIWSGMDGNIISFNIHQPDKIRKYPVTGNNYLQTFYLSKEAKFWICTNRFLGYLHNQHIKEFISFADQPNFPSFHLLTETPDGRLIGISSKGIYFVDTKAKKFIPFLVTDEFSSIRFLSIDNFYRCWITTYGKGIFVYDLKANKLFKFPVDDKGYLLYSHACIDDEQGNFIVPTNKGLFRLSKKNLLQIYAKPSTPLYYEYYDVSSGLLTNEFNGGGQNPFNRLPGGDVILPSMQGLVRVKVNDLAVPTNYPLFIDKIETKVKSHQADSAVLFQKNERIQLWHLNIAQWHKPYSQSIFYRTDETTEWLRLLPGERTIRLNELTGGRHLLQVKNQYGFSEKEFSVSSHRFFIEREYYETVWFWFSLAVLIVIVILLFVRVKNVQLKRKNIQLQKIIQRNTKELSDKNGELEETLMDLNEALKGLQENSVFKNRLIALLGHDILVPLRFIANISEHLHSDADTLTPAFTKDSSGEIKNTAAGLLYLGESLIQWIKLGEGTFRLIRRITNLEHLVNEIITVHKQIATVKNNGIVCKIPPGLSCVYDGTFLKVILHNLLLNANKFTANGNITVGAQIMDNLLTMYVNDTGTGMKPEVIQSLNNLIPVTSQNGTNKETGWGMGYVLIIDLLGYANGKLYVESTKGVGTKVSFSVPLD